MERIFVGNQGAINMKHTRGPWNLIQPLVVKNGTRFKVEANEGDDLIADIVAVENGSSTLANAQLIASAPEMLRGLELAVTVMKSIHNNKSYRDEFNIQNNQDFNHIENIIKKAKGL